jgi:hypothetical protein
VGLNLKSMWLENGDTLPITHASLLVQMCDAPPIACISLLFPSETEHKSKATVSTRNRTQGRTQMHIFSHIKDIISHK